MEPEKADSLASELREKWAAMTKAEKREITKDAVEALTDRNENKEYALHNTSISSFHDARANLESIEDQVRPMCCSFSTAYEPYYYSLPAFTLVRVRSVSFLRFAIVKTHTYHRASL